MNLRIRRADVNLLRIIGALAVLQLIFAGPAVAERSPRLKLNWQSNILTISGDRLPGGEMKILYLEAYCRNNSHTTDWSAHTVIPHKAELISTAKDGSEIKLRDTLQ